MQQAPSGYGPPQGGVAMQRPPGPPAGMPGMQPGMMPNR